jgi:hypothetical protein
MTFVLDAGLQIRIPNSQFIIPDLTINPQTGKTEYNSSVRELLINPLMPPNDQDTPELGRQFFTSTYMMVNYDSNTFTLWKANPTEDVNLIPILNSRAAQSCSAQPGPQGTTGPSSGIQKKKVMSGAAIAGIVIGSIATFILIVIAILFYRKRKTHTAVPTDNPHDYSNAGKSDSWFDSSQHHPPQELGGDIHWLNEVEGPPRKPVLAELG